MFADCVVVRAAVAAVLADVLVLSVIAAAVTVWNAVVELLAAAAASAASVAVERVCGSAAELVHAAE